MAYRAEIEIGVKGANKLEQLQTTIDALANKITKLNDESIFDPVDPKLVQSIRNYSNALDVASENLRDVALGTKEEANAVKNYVDILGQSNAARARQNSLIDQQIAKQTAANRVVREASTGFSAARYGPQVPAGTGRQGDPEFASSPIEQRTQRLLQAQREELELKEALRKLDEQSIKDQNTKLDLQAKLVTVLNRTRDAAKFRAAQPAQQLALPAFRERGLQLLDDSVKANESQLRIEQALNGERARGVRFLEKQSQEEKRQLNLGITGTRTKALPADPLSQERALAVAAAKRTENLAIQQRIRDTSASTVLQFNLQKNVMQQIAAIGQQISKSTEQELVNQRRLNRERKVRLGRERQRRTREGVGSAIIGGAFPLLFGQGLGAAAGGAAGGFGGGLIGGQFGFGLSLVGTQIGSFFDQITNKSIELGKALDPVSGDLAAVADAAGLAGTGTKTLLQSLKGQISQTQAAELVADQLAVVIGEDGVNALRELGEASNELGREASKAFSDIAASLAPILTAVIKPITEEVSRGRLLSRAPELAASDPEIARLLEQRRGVATAGTKGISGEALLIEEQLITLVRKREEAEKAAADAKLQGISTGRQELTILELQNRVKRLGTDLTDENNAYLEEAILRQKAANEEYKVGVAFASDEITKAEYINKIKVIREGLTGNILDLESSVTKEVERQAKAEERKKERAAREAKRVQKEAERAARATQALSIELQLSRSITDQNIEIAKARRDGNSELVYTLQVQKEITISRANEAKIKNENLSVEDKQLKIAIAREQAAQKLNNLEQAKLDREKDIQDAVDKNLRSIQNEIQLSKARLNGTEDQVKLEQQLQAIKESTGVKDAQALENLKQTLVLLQEQLASEKAIQEVRDIQQRTATAGAGLRAGFIGQAGQAFEQQLQKPGVTAERATEIALLTQEMELAELQAQSMENAVLGIGDAFATAMTTGVSELIAGTKSAEEVFSNFLKGVANALLQSAQQMIATYIAIGIARAFAGMGTSGGDPNSAAVGEVLQSGGFTTSNMADQAIAGTFSFASGGYVSGPTRALVGEGGEPEYIIPESKMRESMARYSRGARGGSVIPENGGGGSVMDGGGGTAVAAPIDVRYTVERINSVDYVTADQFQDGMRQAANQGAKQGEQQTLKRLQMSSSTRKRIGM